MMGSKLLFITQENIMKRNLVSREPRTISSFLLSNTADKPHVVGRYIMYSYRRLSQQQLPPVVYSNSGLAFALGPSAKKKLPNAASSKQSNQANSYFLFPGTPSANQPCVTHQQSTVFSSEAGFANSTGIRSIAKQGTTIPEHQMPNGKG